MQQTPATVEALATAIESMLDKWRTPGTVATGEPWDYAYYAAYLCFPNHTGTGHERAAEFISSRLLCAWDYAHYAVRLCFPDYTGAGHRYAAEFISELVQYAAEDSTRKDALLYAADTFPEAPQEARDLLAAWVEATLA